jgi:isochorismate pyruvate lyase
VRFKKNEEDVFARERYENVFIVRRTWAEANGLDPQTIEDAYKILVHYFIDEQKKLLHLD